MNTQPQNWDYIENKYLKDWNGRHFQLLALVRHIKNTDLANRLFGVISLDKLIVSILAPVDFQKEALHITFDLPLNKWHFTYFAMPFQDPEFVRTYDAEKGIDKFDQFIQMIRW